MIKKLISCLYTGNMQDQNQQGSNNWLDRALLIPRLNSWDIRTHQLYLDPDKVAKQL